jgi:hypothetical protein
MLDLLKKEGVTCYFTQIAQETRRNLIIGTIARGTAATLAPGNQLCRLRNVHRLAPLVRLDYIQAVGG